MSIVAALELGKRRKETQPRSAPDITSSNKAYAVFAPLLSDLPHEEVWIALTNHANRLITTQRIGQGGLSASMADIRIILKAAIENNATGVLLAHNHPSGEPTEPREPTRYPWLSEYATSFCAIM